MKQSISFRVSKAVCRQPNKYSSRPQKFVVVGQLSNSIYLNSSSVYFHSLSICYQLNSFHRGFHSGLVIRDSSITFSDSVRAYQAKTLPELVRSYIVFKICQIPFIVKRSEFLLRSSYIYLGKSITNGALRATMFGHFCAGENQLTIKPTVDFLQRNGIGSILDYAAESDVPPNQSHGIPLTVQGKDNKVIGRVYDYHSESLCDMHKLTFEKCIQAVKSVSPTGFAAVKVTALGNPELLKRASSAIRELRQLFVKFDDKNTGYVTRTQFAEAYEKFFKSGNVSTIFDSIDADHDGKIDYIEWSNGLKLEELHLLTSHCREIGPLASAVLTDEELKLFYNMKKRIDDLASLAASLGVRLMIDAEHTYFQPAIDHITNELMKKYNKEFPAIFGTYQMYLKDSSYRLAIDIERAKKGNYKFAAKLVRGAYMVLERAHAQANKLPDPIHNTIQETHHCYNRAISDCVKTIASGHKFEILIATHNQASVEHALKEMAYHGLGPSHGVYFGQLLGMSDNITFSLGHAGYKAYKYVPYGKIEEVMPYLVRRVQENSDALSGAKLELQLTGKEIRRRLLSLIF